MIEIEYGKGNLHAWRKSSIQWARLVLDLEDGHWWVTVGYSGHEQNLPFQTREEALDLYYKFKAALLESA